MYFFLWIHSIVKPRLLRMEMGTLNQKLFRVSQKSSPLPFPEPLKCFLLDLENRKATLKQREREGRGREREIEGEKERERYSFRLVRSSNLQHPITWRFFKVFKLKQRSRFPINIQSVRKVNFVVNFLQRTSEVKSINWHFVFSISIYWFQQCKNKN